MRITMVTHHFWPCVGGVEKVVLDTAEKLVERGHEVKVVCLNKCAYSQQELRTSDKTGEITVHRIPFFDLKYYKVATKVLDEIKDAEIVHVHGVGFFSDFLLLTRPIHRKPVIVSTHGGIFHTADISPIKKIYLNGLQRFVLGLADKVIAVSKNDYKEFGKVCGNIVLIENGVDVTSFKSATKKRNSFLFLGRFARNKRVEKLLEVFSSLKDKGFVLVIAGNDWEGLHAEYLKKNVLLGIDPKVKFVLDPSGEKIRKLYSEAQFFVSASQHEGFGLSLVEAMASGCIPIVQNNEGFASIIGDSECGFLTDFGDKKEATDLIASVMDWTDTRKAHLSKAAVQKAKGFSWEKRIEALLNIYMEKNRE